MATTVPEPRNLADDTPLERVDPATKPRARDAERSREAILEAAERQFASRGFDGASLQEIAAAAGLSRGTPSYFFGSKESLYEAVLERVFEERDKATRRAFEPVLAWAAGRGDARALERALEQAVAGYLEFLIARRSFVRLLDWEAIGGGGRIHRGRSHGPRPARGNAMNEAFAAVRRVARGRHLAAFDVDDVVLVTVALTFSIVSQRATLMSALARDIEDPATVRRHTRLVVGQLLALIAPGEPRA
jgi:TetR/AcrR family transcriptional regulator